MDSSRSVVEEKVEEESTRTETEKAQESRERKKCKKFIDNISANQSSKQDTITANATLPGSTLRNVAYYQNRFIVLDTVPSKSGATHALDKEETADVQKSVVRTGCGILRMSERHVSGAGEKSNERAARAAGGADDSLLVRGKTGNMEMDASSVTMDARAIEIVVSDESDSQRMHTGIKHPLWKRITSVMRDNRMKGRRDCDIVLRDHPEENRVLKRVLNIVFVTIGVALLLSVFIVIIYTAVVGDQEKVDMRNGKDIALEKYAKTNSSETTVSRQKRYAIEFS